MKKTLFLSLILSCLCGLSARGEYTLDTAVGSYYYDSSTSSWAGNNITSSNNADGGLTLTYGENIGSGYNFTMAITLDASKLAESISGNTTILQGQNWALGIRGDDLMIVGVANSNYGYSSSLSLDGQEGLYTFVVTMSSYGTVFMDDTMGGGGNTSYKASNAGNSSSLTLSASAADALVGIATWNTTTTGSPANRIEAYNSLSKVTGGNTISYPDAFVKTRTDGTSLGRILFMGDSITHGIADATWRWQFFKILVDNGMEFEIGGPRSGEDAREPVNTSDFKAGYASYGGVDFADLHYARSSGRTYNMLQNKSGGASYEYDKGGTIDVNSASLLTNADTHFLLIGTNDLLSDSKTTGAQYAATMQTLLGGTVTYDNNTYTWTAGDSAGNMGQIADTVLKDDTDTLYIFSIPTWGTGNSGHPERDTVAYDAVHQYNGLLKDWVEEYNKTSEGTAYYVDINRGLLDVTKTQWIGCNAFFHSGDYLHPNEQGSLIIAGNLAQGMGLAGRTAGQHRLGIEEFTGRTESPVTVTSSTSYTLSDCFGKGEAYTLSLDLTFGNGSTGGWSTTDSFTITSGNGTVGGTLSISEGFIKWGSKTLFSLDMSQNTDTLRIAYVMEDMATSNTGGGYYVWLGDMLIGQALAVSSGDVAVNGFTLSSTLGTTVNNLAYTTGSYAPTSDGLTSEENAYYAVPGEVDLDEVAGQPRGSGVDFSEATAPTFVTAANIYAKGSSSISDGTIIATTDKTVTGWYGAMGGSGVDHVGDIALQVTATEDTKNLFGVVNTGTVTGNVTLVVDTGDASVGSWTASNAGPSIVGGYCGSITGLFKAVLESGHTNDIVGGFHTANNGNHIGAVEIVVNGGTVGGNIYGGSTTANGLIDGDTHVWITGGTTEGNVYGGGTAGTIGGSTNVTISGGVIKGKVYGNNATDLLSGNVTVESNRANIRGDIYADHVTLKDVADGGKEYGFGHYANTISANKLTLDNVTVKNFGATLENVKELEAVEETNTTLNMGEQSTLDLVTLNDSSVILKNGNTLTKVSTGKLDITGGSTLGASLTLSPQASVLLNGSLSLAGGDLSLSTLSLSGKSWENWLEKGGSLTLFSGVSTLNLLDEEGATLNSWSYADGYTFTDEEVTSILRADIDTGTYTLKYIWGSLALVEKSSGEEPTLESVADSHNSAAGAAILTDVLESGVPVGGDLAPALASACSMLVNGETASLNRLMAAMAGSSIATMGAAFNADVDRQLRAIRNRTTSMGGSTDQAWDGELHFHAWVNGEGDYRKLERDGTAAGYTLDSWGGTVGVDVDVCPHLVTGMAVTAMYGDLDADGPDNADGDLDTYYLSLFARYIRHAWTHTFVATVGWADADLDRTVSYPGGVYKTSGSTSGMAFGLLYELGYVLPLNEEGTTCLQPVFNVAWRHTSLDSYTEGGSDAALYAGDQTMDAVTLGLGARLQSVVGETAFNRAVLLETRALLKVDVGDRRNHLDVAMLYGSRRADIESAETGVVGVELGAGVTLPVGADGGSFFIDASADLRSSYTNLNATVGYRVDF